MTERLEEEIHNPIDASKITEMPGLLPYAHTVGGVVIKPEDTGKIKGRAVKAMEQQTDMQLLQIQQQIELLATQARAIQRRTELSYRIYEAAIGFEPLIGQTYHLYSRSEGSFFLSLIGPDEWGRSKGDRQFMATVKLLADHTWDVIKSQEPLEF